MSQFPDELGDWWSDFPGSDRATWLTPATSQLGAFAPAQDGMRGAISRRALKRGVVIGPGKKERARRETSAEWRRQSVAAIRVPALKLSLIHI